MKVASIVGAFIVFCVLMASLWIAVISAYIVVVVLQSDPIFIGLCGLLAALLFGVWLGLRRQ